MIMIMIIMMMMIMMIYGKGDDYEDDFLIEDYHVDDESLPEGRKKACVFSQTG